MLSGFELYPRWVPLFFLRVEVLNVLFLEALRLNNMPGFQRLILADFAVRKNG